MDEQSVREHAEAHAKAVVAGDNNRAGSDLNKQGMGEVGPVMKALPREMTSGEIDAVEADGDAYLVKIRYRGTDDQEVVVQSRWVEEEGRPKIGGLSVQ